MKIGESIIYHERRITKVEENRYSHEFDESKTLEGAKIAIDRYDNPSAEEQFRESFF